MHCAETGFADLHAAVVEDSLFAVGHTLVDHTLVDHTLVDRNLSRRNLAAGRSLAVGRILEMEGNLRIDQLNGSHVQLIVYTLLLLVLLLVGILVVGHLASLPW